MTNVPCIVFVCAFIVVVCGAPFPKKPAVAVNYTNVVNFTDAYEVQWVVDSDTIYFQLTLNNSVRSWLAIGIHPVGAIDSGMTRADVLLSTFEDSTGNLINVSDAWSVKEAIPPFDLDLDCTYDILPGSISGFQDLTTNYTVSRFARKLVTGDTKCDNEIRAGNLEVIYAHGESNAWGYHGHNRGHAHVTLVSGA